MEEQQYMSSKDNMPNACLHESKRAAPCHKGKFLIGISESASEPDGYKGVILLEFLWGWWFLLTCGV